MDGRPMQEEARPEVRETEDQRETGSDGLKGHLRGMVDRFKLWDRVRAVRGIDRDMERQR